jgi:hypothetical protein
MYDFICSDLFEITVFQPYGCGHIFIIFVFTYFDIILC